MSGVPHVAIGDFCQTGSGGTPSRDQMARYYDGGTIPWVKSGELRESVITSTEEHVTEAALKETSVKLVPKNALLVAMYGATVGRLGILGVPATTNQAVCHLVPDPSRAEVRYLFRALETKVSEMLRRTVGGAQPNINQGIVRELTIPLPPLPEQHRIAAILDLADTLRTQRRAALAQLDSLTQSLFLDMFGDPVTNPKGWPIKCMSELFASTPIFGTMIPGDAGGGAWLCLRVANIQDWQLTLADQKYVDLPSSMIERHSVQDGDLLMARAIASQDHLGKCIVARPGNSQWAFDSHLMRLRFAPDRALPDFIRQALRTPGGRSIFLKASRKSSVQYNINTKEISALALPLPPLPLQQTFATRIQAIEALKTQHRAALAAQDALFASLQQRAFAGTL
ncbi:MAG: restriction endonuclease subunit S [Hydrogenophaga sp.]|nr:restriction endonuclease subunit S [Hydrogenophaga sp.]